MNNNNRRWKATLGILVLAMLAIEAPANGRGSSGPDPHQSDQTTEIKNAVNRLF